MNQVETLIIVCVMLICIGVLVYIVINNPPSIDVKPKFQGPVPEGYDENYFRETGITKPIEGINGGNN